MTNQVPDRPRIHSIITKTRFLHLEDALTPQAPGKAGKVRFFIGAYQRGSGEPATTAHHFLDDAAARVLFADLGWGKFVDITDYKGSVNGADGPVSRVLKVKGPTDKGKVWFQISMGPGEVIGQGAVKPKGKAETEISIGLTVAQARQFALAVQEYMLAYRVAHMISGFAHPIMPKINGPLPPTARIVDTDTGEITPPPDPHNGNLVTVRQVPKDPASDTEVLFGTEEPAGAGLAPAPIAPAPIAPAPAQDTPKKAQKEPPAEVGPPTFFALANEAIADGFDLPRLQEIIKSQISWRDKHITLQSAMSA